MLKRLLALAALPFLLAPARAATPEELMRKGHYKRARPLIQAQYREKPNDPETWYLMSLLKQAWDEYGTAVDFAQKAVDADPKNARFQFRLCEATGEAAEKAGALKQIGLARRFKKAADAAVALDPHHADALTFLMEFYLRAPGIVGGDKTKAHTIPAQILAFDPVKGYFAQISLARFDKQTDQIEGLYRKAVAAKPESYEAHMGLGNFLAQGRKFEEAITHGRDAIRIDPDRAGGYGLVGVVLAHQQKWAEIDPLLAEQEKQIPDNLTPWLRVASNCLNLKMELPRAERYLRKYLAQEPEPDMPSHAVAHRVLGLVLEQQGRKPEAIAELQAAVKLDPESPAKQDLKRLK